MAAPIDFPSNKKAYVPRTFGKYGKRNLNNQLSWMPRTIMSGETIKNVYVPVKGKTATTTRANQQHSTMLFTLNHELAQKTHENSDYINSFKTAKDIRDLQNSEYDILNAKKKFIPKVRISLASTRHTLDNPEIHRADS